MYVYGGGALDGTYLGDLTALNLTSKWFGILNFMRPFTYNIQLSDGSHLRT
jgi:hypothetical protein